MKSLGVGLAAAVLAVVVWLSLAIGTKSIALGDVIGALVSFDGSTDHVVVRQLRVPRTIVGLVVGAALGTAGALMQAITRNPLADPGLLGVNAGAALAVVVGISAFGIGSVTAYAWLAMCGALVASVVVFALGSLGGSAASPVRLALAGAAMSALLGGLTSAVVVLDRQTLDQYRFWVVGSLSGRELIVIQNVGPFVAVGLMLAIVCARSLNALALGDEAAIALGVNVVLARVGACVAITLLCGSAVAACGPIAFVGLVVPLAARMLVGTDQRWLLPLSAILGPMVMLACDIVGRVVARPSEVQVGIMTALLGGPAFVVMVRRARLVAR